MVSDEDRQILERVQEQILSLPLPNDPHLSAILNEAFQFLNTLIVGLKLHRPRKRKVPSLDEGGTVIREEQEVWASPHLADLMSDQLNRIFDLSHLTTILCAPCEYCQLENRIPAKLQLHAQALDEEWIDDET